MVSRLSLESYALVAYMNDFSFYVNKKSREYFDITLLKVFMDVLYGLLSTLYLDSLIVVV